MDNIYDAIVVGSGISGGWAAKELTELGLKTLLLERGKNVRHIEDYGSAFKDPWEFDLRLMNSVALKEEYPIQSRSFNFDKSTQQFFVSDRENPYNQVKPFNWIRGYHVGGRSLTWGRLCFRWSDLDFEANLAEGIGVDWPIRYRDLAPWYDYVEAFVGVSGSPEHLEHLPDGKFLPPMEMSCVERHVASSMRTKFKDRIMTIGRTSNLTVPHLGRGPCQYRNLCTRGCPFSGYFSSNSATLPAATATGNLTLRPLSIVTEVIFDNMKNKAAGVRVMDAQSRATTEFYSRIIFLNASTLGTAQILLNSVSRRFPEGLGNQSGQVGRNLMDHPFLAGASGEYEGFVDRFYWGRRPTGVYIPRFRNVDPKTRQKDYLRGFAYQGSGTRSGWGRGDSLVGAGAQYKAELSAPGPWQFWLSGWGECLPYPDNRVTLNRSRIDMWGLPTLDIDCSFRENEAAMRKDMINSAVEILEAAGMKHISPTDWINPPGLCVHEMGTARMGRNPGTSVLNGFNQMHEVPNVFVSDGSCMTSSGTQNPSLTYMALTARACHYAVDELKKGNL